MTVTDGDGSFASPRPRLAVIDALRGAALVAMFSYHLVWDLGFFGFISSELQAQPAFKVYGNAIASAFLVLVGISLVLAERETFAWRRFSVRLGKLVAAAAAITAVTLYVFPDEFIFFGILHCITLASIAALPFLRARLWLVLAAAVVSFALPAFAASPFFNAPPFWWLGLGTVPPRSNDWRPFLPWFGMVLIGVGFARATLIDGFPRWFAEWNASGRGAQGLVWGGRHSLTLYLVHQPVFLALLYGAAQLSGVQQQAEEMPFLRNCQSQCVATGATSTYCSSVCRCIVKEARRSDLWKKMLAPAPDAADEQRFRAVTRACALRERPSDDQ